MTVKCILGGAVWLDNYKSVASLALAYLAERGRQLCRRNNSVRRTPGVQLQTPSTVSWRGTSPLWSHTPCTAARLGHAQEHTCYTPHSTIRKTQEPMASLLTCLLTLNCVENIIVFPTARVLWSKAGTDQLSAAAYCSNTNSRMWTWIRSQEQEMGVKAAHIHGEASTPPRMASRADISPSPR